MIRSPATRRIAWAFAVGWLLGMAIVLSRESVAEAAPHTWASYRSETIYAPALHPIVVAMLQGLGSVLALMTLERARS